MNSWQALRAYASTSAEVEAILMVAITVVLAAVVFVLVSNLSKGNANAPPNTKLAVRSDNTADDIVIQHQSGETIKVGDMKISIMTTTGNPQPSYETCDQGTTPTDFQAGEEIRATTQTTTLAAASCDLETNAISGGTALANGDYRVVIFHIPSSSIMLDQVITIS